MICKECRRMLPGHKLQCGQRDERQIIFPVHIEKEDNA